MFIENFETTAIIYKGKEISYKEVIENVINYSRLHNVERGSKIAIFSENRPEWLFAFFSNWNGGFGSVLIDNLSSSEEIFYVFSDCRPEAVFTSQANIEKLKDSLSNLDYSPKIIVFEDVKDSSFTFSKKEEELRDEETAVYIYTSGTTGKPKGVMLTKDNFNLEIESIDKLNIVEKGEKVIMLLPFHHAYPLTATILEPLHKGATLVIAERLTSEEILGLMKRYKIDIIIAVPRILNLFHKSIMKKINDRIAAKFLFKFCRRMNNLKLGRFIFKSVHEAFGGNVSLIISGGAKLDYEMGRDFWALGFKISEGYGLTETAPIIAFNSRNSIRMGSVGKPLDKVEVKIEDGEIVVKGRNIMKGYYNKKEETDTVLKNGWFYTGDTGYLDKNGYLYVTGRKKDLIILSNGKNINPEEIESKLLAKSGLIKEVSVFEGEGKLSVVIFPDFDFARNEKIINIEETIKWTVVDKYNLESVDYKKIFNVIVSNRELPKTRLGKVKRFELNEFLKKREEREQSVCEEPDTQEYEKIKEFLTELTKKDIKPDDHIEMNIGLDSLDKVEFLYFIEKVFGYKLKNEEFAKYMIVRELSEYISHKRTKLEDSEIDLGAVLRNSEVKINPSSGILLRLFKLVFYPFFKLFFRLEVKGLENIPDSPFILTSNHQSILDAFLIYSVLKLKHLDHIYALAKDKHFKTILRKIIAKNSNILIMDINKDIKDTMQIIGALLKSGGSLLIFPEGARTRTGELGNFKKAFAIIGKELNIPIVPVTIKGAFKAMPIGVKIPKPSRIEIIISKPEDTKLKSYDEIVKNVRAEIDRNI